MEDEIKQFIGQKVTRIRAANDEEYNKIYPEDVTEGTPPLMVADLENGAKLYLFSEVSETDEGETETAIAETKQNEIIQIPEEEDEE